MDGFWARLNRPFFVQAPMEDVTDVAFRRLIARYGKPDVMFTEFTSADGLVLAPPDGQKILRKKLAYDEGERPIVAQLFSAYPERMEKAAAIVQSLGFDGLDINMGCPVREVVGSGCGAALIKTPLIAQELILAAQRGAPKLPISVKTRIGYSRNEIETWLPALLEAPLAAITLHARTRDEMSDVPAHWDVVKRAFEIRNSAGSKTLIIGNGDVKNLDEARARVEETGCDGVMLGRAIYGNPWLYQRRATPPSREEKIKALIEHLDLFEELMSETKNYAVMKKHFKAYIGGWDGAKELRVKLMKTETIDESRALLSDILQGHEPR